MDNSSDMALTIFAAIAIGLVCAPKRAFSLLIALDVVLIILVESYAATRIFHDFGDSLFKFASATLLASGIAFCVLAGFIHIVSAKGPQGGQIRPAASGDWNAPADPESGIESGWDNGVAQNNSTSMLMHLAGLCVVIQPLLGFLVAFGLWLWKRKAEPFTAYHATAMLIFQAVFLAGLALLAVIGSYFLVAWYIAAPVVIIRAAFLAGHGHYRSYPFVNKLFNFWKKRSEKTKSPAEG